MWKSLVAREFFRGEALRFAVVGAANSFMSYGIFFLAIDQGLNHWVANLLALFFGIFIGFKSGGLIVFRNPDPRLWKRFCVAWIFIYIVISGLIGVFSALGVDIYLSGLLALPFSALLSFFLQKYFVFGC